jgi:cytochrome c peroxidase
MMNKHLHIFTFVPRRTFSLNFRRLDTALLVVGFLTVGGSTTFGQSAPLPSSIPPSDAATAPPPSDPAQSFSAAPAVNPAPPASAGKVTLDDLEKTLNRLRNPPRYFANTYRSAMTAPLPSIVFHQGGIPRTVPTFETDRDPLGRLGSYQPGGPVQTSSNAFFQSLGTNGRSCASCHQPGSAMSVSVSNIQERFVASQGDDPIFSPVDGANCPNQVPAIRLSSAPVGQVGHITGGNNSDLASAYSLLLNKGLFRIFIEVPTETLDPTPHPTEFTVTVVNDPPGCNTDPNFNKAPDGHQLLSMYRRPRVSAGMNYVTTTTADLALPPAKDPITGDPIQNDPITNKPESGNVMWDGREPTLEHQATDATLGHAQAATNPTLAEVMQIVAFEKGIFSAQSWDAGARSLTENGGLGGPVQLSSGTPGLPLPTGPGTFALFGAWQSLPAGADRAAERESVARGEQIFNTRKFTISGVAGLNNNPAVPNPLTGTCSGCHSQVDAGNSAHPDAQLDIGIANTAVGPNKIDPSPDLPVFDVQCTGSFTTPFNGNHVKLHDLGLGLITGRCADLARFTIPQLRGLAARAPYFHDGSAATLVDVVDFYDGRFGIGLSAQEKQDLIDFLRSL